MADNIRDLRRRIRSVKNTSQLTRAMKMVSAAKLRRAQESMMRSRPYAGSLKHVLAELSLRVQPERHALLTQREPRRVDLVIVSGDKGLCGSFNSTVLRAADDQIAALQQRGAELKLTLVGKTSAEYYRRHQPDLVLAGYSDVFRTLEYSFAVDLAQAVQDRYTAKETDSVMVVHNEFKSTISQNLICEPLLPLSPIAAKEAEQEKKDDGRTEYIYEPDADQLLAQLLPRYVTFRIYQALMESMAAEHAARMTAMDAATRNAEEMIEKLTLVMNRARQAAITTEIIEVVSGAAALG